MVEKYTNISQCYATQWKRDQNIFTENTQSLKYELESFVIYNWIINIDAFMWKVSLMLLLVKVELILIRLYAAQQFNPPKHIKMYCMNFFFVFII